MPDGGASDILAEQESYTDSMSNSLQYCSQVRAVGIHIYGER